MDTVQHAARLLGTESAWLGVSLAAVLLAAALLLVLRLALGGNLRLLSALLVLVTGSVVATAIVDGTYDAWYRHRCVDHSSDIPECDTERRSARPGVGVISPAIDPPREGGRGAVAGSPGPWLAPPQRW